jgi:hypothetical protein
MVCSSGGFLLCYQDCLMNVEPQHPRPRFWPVVFLVAFLGGAMLWTIWMYHVVVKTREQVREQRDNSFFVPPASAPIIPGTNTAPAATGSNVPAQTAPAQQGK